MPSPEHNLTSGPEAVAQIPRGVTPRTAEELHRLAALVAAGELPFPADLPIEQMELLVRQVAKLRRARLVKHIARAIARDLLGQDEPKMENA